MDSRRGRQSHKEGVEQACARVMARQLGLITRSQAIRSGLTEKQIAGRLAGRTWRARHRGVYANNAVPRSWKQDVVAAWLWVGPGAAISHRTAAVLWQLIELSDCPIEVTAPKVLRHKTIIVHRNKLERTDFGRLGHVAITNVARTLMDMGAVVRSDLVESGLESALRRELITYDDLYDRLVRMAGRGRRGAAALRHILAARGDVPSATELELKLKRVLANGGLFPPERQYPVYADGRFVGRPDFAYPEQRVAIEAESYQWHWGRQAFERDLVRRNQFTTYGWILLHFTWARMRRHPDQVVAETRHTLRQRGLQI